MRNLMTRPTFAIVMLLLMTSVSRSDTFLSDYLGGASGTAVTASNAPFTTVVTVAQFGGFGVNTAGAFSGGAPIDFTNTAPFAKGIGAHPISRIDFNLASFRSFEPVNSFRSVVGINVPSSGANGNGARFNVYLDGVPVLSQLITNGAMGGVSIAVPIGNQSTLSLETLYAPNLGSNHAAWADARFSSVPVPEPATLTMLTVSLVGAFCCRKLRRI